jgi:hypothetical protein
VQQRFTAALDHAVERYHAEIAHLRDRDRRLPNETLDTGRPTRRGDYEPADETYAKLLEKLDERHFAGVPPALQADIMRFYGQPDHHARDHDDDDEAEVRDALARLAAAPRR